MSFKDIDDILLEDQEQGQQQDEEEESITPIADLEIKEFEAGGNGHDDNRKENKGRKGKERKDRNSEAIEVKTHTVYKYSTDIPLVEEILLNNQSVFLQIIDGQPKISSMIDLTKQKGIVLVPHENSSQVTAPVVIPYSFKDIEEIEYFISVAKLKSIDDLFLMSESIWDKILVAKSSEVIIFYAVDTIYSYFQDLFPTTHYVMIVGNPGAGKGAILVSFRLQGYRAVMAAGMSGANLLELLGSVEALLC
jgi:hypothetical protein